MSTTPNDPNQPGSNDPSQSGPSYGSTPSYGDSSTPGAAPQYGQSTPAYGDASQPAYGAAGAPGYGTPAPSANNGLAIVSLVLGVLSILSLCIAIFTFAIPGILFGVAAVVTGWLASAKVKRGEAGQGGLAKAGFITGIVGVVLGILTLIAIIAGFAFLGDNLDDVESCSTLPVEEQQACLEDVLEN